MTEYTVVREDRWWKFRLGFGRMQKARGIAYSLLPEKLKRAQIADPNLTAEAAREILTPQELIDYGREKAMALVLLVLDDAYDWNRNDTPKDAYVDGCLPEDVGQEIVERLQALMEEGSLDSDSKKN